MACCNPNRTGYGCNRLSDLAVWHRTSRYLLPNPRPDSGGSGDDVNTGLSISTVTGLVTGITFTNNNNVLVEGTSGEGAIKVLSGIGSTDVTKNVTLTTGANNSESVKVTIQVKPDK